MATRIEATSRTARRAASSASWAGFLLVATGALSIAIFLIEEDSGWLWQGLYWASTVTLVVSAASIFLLGNALRREYESGRFGVVGVFFAGLGTVASVIAWAFPLWGIPLGIATMIFGSILLNEGTSPRTPVILFGFSMVVGLLTFFLLDSLEVGTVSSFGDYEVAIATGLFIMLFGTGIGLIGVGRHLRVR